MRLLILGTGWMAQQHARHFAKIEGVELVGAVDVDRARVDEFADGYGIPNRFTSLEEALAWEQFDAVANVTPDRIHHPTTMRLIEAGKQVFCEKPLATDYAKAERDGRGRRGGRPRQHGQPHLSQRRRAAEGARAGARRRHRRGQARRGVLPAELAGLQGLGRLAHRSRSGCGGCRTSHGSNGVLGDIGIHILDFASYGAGARHRPCVLPAQDLRQGARQQDRRIQARRQRQLHHGGRFHQRRHRRHPCHPLGHRPSQRAAAARLWRQGRRSRSCTT